MKEIFKLIPGTDNKYHVSNLGNVKGPTGVIRKLRKNRHGYYKLMINRKCYGVHQLVAMAFLNHKPCGHKIVVDHINNNKLDNRLENLRWGTRKENVADSIKHGVATIGARNGQAQLTVDMVKVIRQSKLTKDSVAKLSDQFQVSNSVIRKVLNGLTYKGI